MELVKRTPEEQAKIDKDRSRPHAAVVVFGELDPSKVFQDHIAEMIELATVAIKERADNAKMIVLSTSLSTNTAEVTGVLCHTVTILCQWAEIEKLEEQQRRQFIAAGGGPGGRRGA